MSYSIIYNKVVLEWKKGRKYPIIQMGASNCYDYAWKREREWCIPTQFINYSKEEATEIIKNMLIKNGVSFDEKVEDQWLEMDSKWYLGLQNGTKWTMKKLINTISKVTDSFEDNKELKLSYSIKWSYEKHYITLEELDSKNDDFYKKDIAFFYLSDYDIEAILEKRK